MSTCRHVAIYPGSFDPITHGHLDVIRRGRKLFDEVVVAVGRHPGKDQLFSSEERVEMIETLVAQIVRAEPSEAAVHVHSFSGLTVDFASAFVSGVPRAGQAQRTVLLRGIRNLSDLQNEVQQALTNRQVGGLETVFVVAGQDFAYTSSSLIKQITAMGENLATLETMVPPMVADRLKQKKQERHPVLERLRANRDETAEV